MSDPSSLLVLDVRSPAEFESAHIAGSYNVPLATLGEHAEELARTLDRRVVLVCQSGVRAEQARQHLAAAGYDRLDVLQGGVPAYEAADGRVVRGQQRWHLERQVRLVAGLIVLVGTLLSFVVPAMIVVPLLVGAGLSLAALTNTCVMGALLMRLPYNRGPGERTLSEIVAQLRVAQDAA